MQPEPVLPVGRVGREPGGCAFARHRDGHKARRLAHLFHPASMPVQTLRRIPRWSLFCCSQKLRPSRRAGGTSRN
ncbi:hypothetical protein [Kamptonema formosum]|uniref:hypothetical protein n=1 Tax=Kamptonema formosum TaxID=331992 RepID=UPI00034B85D8|nr:hypothetical protein [Oscillatoria sp. PCC 10802]